MPLPLSAHTTTGRPFGAVPGWVAMAKAAYISPATVQDPHRSVQSAWGPGRVRIRWRRVAPAKPQRWLARRAAGLAADREPVAAQVEQPAQLESRDLGGALLPHDVDRRGAAGLGGLGDPDVLQLAEADVAQLARHLAVGQAHAPGVHGRDVVVGVVDGAQVRDRQAAAEALLVACGAAARGRVEERLGDLDAVADRERAGA